MMQEQLFSNESHDPGGKVATPMPAGMHGAAEFYGPRDCYRLWTSRWWVDDPMAEFALWIGMNPSMATAFVNDPTVTREVGFTREWGYGAYMKCNAMDYRATDQKLLRSPGVVPCSDRNLETIRAKAADANCRKIILCFGAPHKSLRRYGEQVVSTLKADGRKMFCMRLTKDGLPGHPLYVPYGTEPQRYAA
jgi:hypothetical protein